MNSRPIFPLTLWPTYYREGFFNVTVEFDGFVRHDEGPVILALADNGKVTAHVDRTANPNGTARIRGNAALRDWCQATYQQMDTVPVRFDTPNHMTLGGG